MVGGSVLEVKNLSYSTPEGRMLQAGINFDLQAGQMLLITGSNGCGKSTLLKTLLGEFPAVSGKIAQKIPETRLEYIPQLENTEIHLPLTLRDVLAISQPRPLDLEEVESFGLLRREQLKGAWNTASGGERKRTLLTRALLRRPSLLVFDEPMNHLDRHSRRAMIGVMSSFLKTDREARAIVMVCHQGLHDDEDGLFDYQLLDLDQKVREV